MAFQRDEQIVGRHATAIIFDDDPFQAPRFDGDRNTASASVQSILDQFLDGGRRALDHFAHRDPVHDIRWQLANLGARADGIRHLVTIPRLTRFVPACPHGFNRDQPRRVCPARARRPVDAGRLPSVRLPHKVRRNIPEPEIP